jgi:hypothetical protein
VGAGASGQSASALGASVQSARARGGRAQSQSARAGGARRHTTTVAALMVMNRERAGCKPIEPFKGFLIYEDQTKSFFQKKDF